MELPVELQNKFSDQEQFQSIFHFKCNYQLAPTNTDQAQKYHYWVDKLNKAKRRIQTSVQEQIFRQLLTEYQDYARYPIIRCFMGLIWLEELRSDPNSLDTAYNLFYSVLDQINWAYVGIGWILEQKNMLVQAGNWYKKARDLDVPQGWVHTGTMLYYGHGMNKDIDSTLMHYLTAKQMGYWLASYNLGQVYSTKGDHTLAFQHYSDGAMYGHNECFYELAKCWLNGQGTVINIDLAIHYFSKALNLDHIEAGMYLIELYTKSKNWDKYLEVTTKLTQLGSADGWNYLWKYYAKYTDPPNWSSALECAHQGMILGSSQAYLNLGYQYYDGKGIDMNRTKAFELYSKAALMGNASAHNNLAYIYGKGEGIQKNNSLSRMHFTIGARLGSSCAQYNIGQLCIFGDDDQPTNYTEGYEYILQSLRQDCPEAWGLMGWIYAGGLGVKQNYKIAVECYKKSIELGCPNQKYDLGFCYVNGLGIDQNAPLALELWTEAAADGSVSAMNALGDMFFNGNREIKPDLKKAIEYYKSAAARGHSNAKSSLESIQKLRQSVENAVEDYIDEQIDADGVSCLFVGNLCLELHNYWIGKQIYDPYVQSWIIQALETSDVTHPDLGEWFQTILNG